MATTRKRTERLGTAIAITIIVLLSGCSSEEPVVNQPPPVDPRFASADALLATFNEIITQPRVDPYAWIDLFYAENDLQRRLLACLRELIPLDNLEQTVYEKFGEHFRPDRKSPPFAPDKPSSIIEYNDQRAIAEGINTDGETYKTYFVQVGDRWWISGFTFEYDPKRKVGIEGLDAFERLVEMIAPAAPAVLNNIESGVITSVEEARLAFQAELARRNP